MAHQQSGLESIEQRAHVLDLVRRHAKPVYASIELDSRW
jgi:hypothetical protein